MVKFLDIMSCPGLVTANGMFEFIGMKNRISEIRMARGLTLVEVAKLANTSNQQISHLERGRRKLSYEWMERLADALSCHPMDLIADSPADAPASMSALSPRERELLKLFRSVGEREQDALLDALQPMVAFITMSHFAPPES